MFPALSSFNMKKKGLSNTSWLSNPLQRVPLSPAIFPNRLSHHSCGPLQPRTLSLIHSWSVYNHRKTMRSLKPRRGKQRSLVFSTYSIKRSSFPCSLTSIAHYCGPMQPHTLSLSHKIHAISTSNCFARRWVQIFIESLSNKNMKNWYDLAFHIPCHSCSVNSFSFITKNSVHLLLTFFQKSYRTRKGI